MLTKSNGLVNFESLEDFNTTEKTIAKIGNTLQLQHKNQEMKTAQVSSFFW